MIGTTAEQLRTLLAKHIPDERMKDEGGGMKGENTAGEGSDSSFILRPSSFRTSPICAALSGTTTSTCWKRAPRFSRGMLSLSPAALSPRMANW